MICAAPHVKVERMSVRDVFDRSAEVYDRARRQLVPCFDEFYGAVIDGLLHRRDDAFSVLDLGAGTGLLTLFIVETFPRATATLVDVSEEMLRLARARLAKAADRVRLVTGDYSRVEVGERFDGVVSALSIHHLDEDGKQALFRSVYAWLRPGGVFINADQVAGATPALDRQNRESWLAAARDLGVTAGDLDAALERMKEDRPSTVDAQLAWLTQAGFAAVRCVLDRGMFAVFSAHRR